MSKKKKGGGKKKSAGGGDDERDPVEDFIKDFKDVRRKGLVNLEKKQTKQVDDLFANEEEYVDGTIPEVRKTFSDFA